MDTQPDSYKEGSNDKDKLLQKVRERYRIMYDADHENRLEAMEDLKFVNVPGYQWDSNMKQERGKRPCYEFNKVRVFGKRIINDMRANRPAGKIRAVEGGDKETAEINEGLIRNIWNVSDADSVIDYAAEFQVNAGMAAWRIDTEYSDDTAFDQDICIKPIPNPFCLYVDPSCKDFMKRDAVDWLLTEKMSVTAYKKRWPKAEQSNFEESLEFDDEQDWQSEDHVRVAEYWWKEPHKKEIWLMRFPQEDGTVEDKVVDSESDEGVAIAANPELSAQIVRRREVMTHKIMSCIASGDAILEGPSEWAGTRFPFVMIFGEYLVVDGRPYWWGLPRFAKDAQRSYNIARTAISETIAQAPKSYSWATTKQAAGLTNQWADAHKKNFPFMIYNHDDDEPGPPKRVGGADVPQALIAESTIASDEIKAVTGLFDPSLGAEPAASSGRAIIANQQQGEIATFNYQDNMSKGIQLTWELVLDLIPHIYDTERELRILGSDDAEDYKRVNEVVGDIATGVQMRVNDITTGRYDVTITTGPNFSTKRQEATELYGQLTQQYPAIMDIAGDLLFKAMDLPYADDIADRMKMMLPPEIQKTLDNNANQSPEVMQAMAQAEAAMAQVQEHGQLVQAAAAELEEEKGEAAKMQADIKQTLADIKVAKAEFDADIAEQKAMLVEREAKITMREAGVTQKTAEYKSQVAEGTANAADEASQKIDEMDNILANFLSMVDNALGDLNEKAETLQKRTGRKITSGTTRREGSRLVADIEFDDGERTSLSAERKDGQLRIVPDSGAEAGG